VVIVRLGKRFRLSATDRAEVWRRWKDGHSLHAIGHAFSRAHPVVHRLLKQHGGIDCTTPGSAMMFGIFGKAMRCSVIQIRVEDIDFWMPGVS
jgi:hypothetical protein